MANHVDFNLNVGGKFYRISYALPKDPYAISGIFLALKEEVSRITNEPNPEIFLNDGLCKTVIASTCDVLTAIGNAKMKNRGPICVNIFVADPEIKKLKDLLAKKEEENSKLAAELDKWKEVYANLYDRDRKSISNWKNKVAQLESDAATRNETIMKMESENQDLKLKIEELEANLYELEIKMEAMVDENRELNEDIEEKDTLIRHLQEKVDLFHEHLHEFGQIFNASREPEQDQELLNHKDCIAVSGKVLQEDAESEGGWVTEDENKERLVDIATDDFEEGNSGEQNKDEDEKDGALSNKRPILPNPTESTPSDQQCINTAIEIDEAERKISEQMNELKAVPFWNCMASFSMKMESIREKIEKMEEKIDVIEEKEDDLDDHIDCVEDRLNKVEKRVEENKEVLLIMEVVPIFKLDFNGTTHRFDIPLRSEELFRAVKQKVAEIIDDENPEMFWTDGNSNTLIKSPNDLHNAIVFGLKGKPWFFLSPCVTLVVTNPLIHKCDRLKEQLAEKEKNNSALGQKLDATVKEVQAPATLGTRPALGAITFKSTVARKTQQVGANDLYEKYPWLRSSQPSATAATSTPATACSPTKTPGWHQSSLQKQKSGSPTTRRFVFVPSGSTHTTSRPTAQGGTPTPCSGSTSRPAEPSYRVLQMKETAITVVEKMEEMKQFEQENQSLKKQNEELERNSRVSFEGNFDSQMNLLKSIGKFETRIKELEDEKKRMQDLLAERDVQISDYKEQSARKNQQITELQDKLKKATSCIPLPCNRLPAGLPMGVLVSETMERSFMYENGCVTQGHPLYAAIRSSFDAQHRHQQELFATSINAEIPEVKSTTPEVPSSIDETNEIDAAQAPPLHAGFNNEQVFREEKPTEEGVDSFRCESGESDDELTGSCDSITSEAAREEATDEDEDELSSLCESGDSDGEVVDPFQYSAGEDTTDEVAGADSSDEAESKVSDLSSLNYHGSDDDDLRPYFVHQNQLRMSAVYGEENEHEKCESAEEDHQEEDRFVADYTRRHVKERIAAAQVEARECKIAAKIAVSKAVPFWDRMASFSEKMNSIGVAVKRVEERIEQLEGSDEVKKMIKMEEKMDEMEERLEGLE